MAMDRLPRPQETPITKPDAPNRLHLAAILLAIACLLAWRAIRRP